MSFRVVDQDEDKHAVGVGVASNTARCARMKTRILGFASVQT